MNLNLTRLIPNPFRKFFLRRNRTPQPQKAVSPFTLAAAPPETVDDYLRRSGVSMTVDGVTVGAPRPIKTSA